MEIGLRIITCIFLCLRWILSPVFWWKSTRPIHTISPIQEPLLELSASRLAKKIRQKLTTSEEIVAAYIKRIKEVNPILNAVVEDRFSAAIQDAKNVDKFIAETTLSINELELQKPLLGIPITIKEGCSLGGMSGSSGSLTFLGRRAQSDGDAVALVKAAGAIPLLVTTTPELCLSIECTNLTTGTTHNPHNTNKASGGSSGGEGALLGAGASVIGLGSDVAGSIRIPAMFNGVFGHKPSPRLVSLEGHFPTSSDENYLNYLVIGPLVRYAEDLKLMMKVLIGKEQSLKIKLDEKVDLSKLTVFYMKEASNSALMHKVQEEIRDSIETAVKHLEEGCKANISNFKFTDMEESSEIGIALICGMKDIMYILDDPETNVKHNLYVETFKSLLGLSKFSLNLLLFYILLRTNVGISRKNYSKYVAACDALRKKFTEKLGTSGVFLYPSHNTSAFIPGESILKSTGMVYSVIFNVLGLPSTQVPLGTDQEGMPVGFQVVAAPNQDRLCLAVAEELERRFGGWIKPYSQKKKTL